MYILVEQPGNEQINFLMDFFIGLEFVIANQSAEILT